ncbi:response regulator transcription factor [bacterium]|nr:response regulator transcription factor [bacterium]
MKKIDLTEQEQLVLTFMANGFTRKHAAKQLNISYPKCLKIVRNIKDKFETDRIAVCIVQAFYKGYITSL